MHPIRTELTPGELRWVWIHGIILPVLCVLLRLPWAAGLCWASFYLIWIMAHGIRGDL